MIYLIRQERLIKELSAHAKGKGKGVLNWYIDSEDNGLLHIYYDFANVTYCCILERNSISEELRTYLGNSREILGILEEKGKEKEEDELFEHPFTGDL